VSTSVDGLVSGLDTSTIISQLMSIEKAPQNRLKTSLSSAQSEVLSFQTVNKTMASLQAAADKVRQASTWTASTATSSSSSVTAAATSDAVTGSTTFSVTQLATAASTISTRTFSSLTDTTGADSLAESTFEIRSADGTGSPVTVTPKDHSLSALVTAINADPTTGVRAAAVQVSAGVYKLQLTATQTGVAHDFSLTGAGGAPLTDLASTTVSAAKDAVLHVGDATAGFDITSSSNTVEGVMPGVTVKVTGLANDVTISTSRDQSAITSSVKALVDAANGALGMIGNQITQGTLSSNGTRSGAGPLAGNSQMKLMVDQILSTVTSGIGGTSLSSVGIASTKDGTLTFDATAFGNAFTKDPKAVQALFVSTPTTSDSTLITTSPTGTGLADKLSKIGFDTSSSGGTIQQSIDGHNSTIKDLTDRIADWDVRLASKQTSLQAQYSALEVALGKLKNQSTWLAGQLNALSSNSGSSS